MMMFRRGGWPVQLGGLVLATSMLGIACGSYDNSNEPPKPTSNWTIDQARMYTSFPLYWLGESYQQLALSYMEVSSYQRVGFRDGVEFWYGEAKFPGGESDYWTPPLKIAIYPYCSYTPSAFVAYMQSLKNYGIDSGDYSSVRVGNADGYLKRYTDSDENLYLWSGDNTIELNTYSVELDTEEAARRLIGLNALATDPLPAATTKSCPSQR